MRAWLITIGEPLPIDGCNERLLRTGILAERMANLGHEVVWWTSTFDHIRKKQRSKTDSKCTVAAGYELQLLKANGYRSNVSLRRIFNHRAIAREFRSLAPTMPSPGVILCSWPTVELCAEAVRFGHARNVPVVLDVRDMWPDAIVDLAPIAVRPLARIAMNGAYRQARYAASGASAILGISEKVVDWGVSVAGRARGELDRAFPMGYRQPTFTSSEVAAADEFWNRKGVAQDNSTLVVCFFGTIGRHFEFEPIVHASRVLKEAGRRVQFVLCGDGPHAIRWRELAAGCDNVILPGWVDAAKIHGLMNRASLGIAPYYSSWDFSISIPNKPIEYLSAKLPVVSSLQGELADMLAKWRCGYTYQNGSGADLVRVLIDCYDHPAKLAELAKNASHLYQTRFVAETVYGELSESLADLAGRVLRQRAA